MAEQPSAPDPVALPRSVPQAVLTGAVRAYRYFLSPWLGSACRFTPTCSAYALEALDRHGATIGAALVVGRLGRCHPGCPGGFDPPPVAAPRFFTALLGRASRTPSAPGSIETTS